MITQTDAIRVGKAIVSGMVKEITYSPESRFNVRGSSLESLTFIWYDVLPEKVRRSFDYEKSNFLAAINWPD